MRAGLHATASSSLLVLGTSVAALALLFAQIKKAGERTFPVVASGGIIISGASTGIGRHAAESLASLGPYLVFAGVRNERDAAAIQAVGNERLVPVMLDVTSTESINSAAAHVKKELDKRGLPLAAVVNNAGVSLALPIELVDLSQLRQVLDVNLIGPVAMAQAFMPMLRESKGARLINVGSFLGLTVAPLYGAYSASKFGLEAVTDAMRMELAPWNISVSLLEPGSIKTAIQGKVIGENGAHLKLSKEQYELYRPQFEAWEQAVVQHDQDSGDVSLTTDALTHAITSPTPRTRYVLGSHKGVPLSVSRLLLPFMPDRVQDGLKLKNVKV